mmetsp:Transcript_12918/g.32957  ORF Transcript_12918/g.32957 Transcript_12918/m.32957 type:complete len:464 (-) Transcript_12918:247-1638(-)|eukprot:CAMPEP_0177674072 /NCGR_PEP_ID=MMETSP0447-20121125/26336_1 /TAXON_ID=0 /ORGANISM="Stygamoeba regulata, Strain BSH-02190019" /LENGTH=463 /DNA_ID=CAMNT_0019182095 /DNA_START=211 /DNA_END=1602 /DNA_ORIENTATION=+
MSDSSKSSISRTKTKSSTTVSADSGAETSLSQLDFVKRFGKRILEDRNLVDVQFVVEKNRVPAHLAVVEGRADQLLLKDSKDRDFKSNKAKKRPIVVELKHVSNVTVFQQLLKYLYEDVVDFDNLSLTQILELDYAATNYEIKGLIELCEATLFSFLTLETVYGIMKGANDKNLENVKRLCMDFALRHYKVFVKNKVSVIETLKVDLFQQVVERHVDLEPDFEKTDPLKPAPFVSTLIKDFTSIYSKAENTDAVITVKGERIPFHKAIVFPSCPMLASLLFSHGDSSELPGDDKISSAAFKSFLSFQYYGDAAIAPDRACELLPFCQKYKLDDLRGVCEGIITKPSSVLTSKTCLDILQTSYLPYNRTRDTFTQVRVESMDFVVKNFTEIDFTALLKMVPFGFEMAADIVIAYQKSGGGSKAAAPADQAPQPHSTTTIGARRDSKTSRKARSSKAAEGTESDA